MQRLISAGVLAITAGGCAVHPQPAQQLAAQQQLAQLQLPPGRVYAFRSSARGGCPALDWHVVLQPGGVLDGMVSWNNMQSFARASGNVNAQTGTFHMTATEVGGQARTADIDGTVNTNTGRLTANIQGPDVNCQGVQVPWFVPYRGPD